MIMDENSTWILIWHTMLMVWPLGENQEPSHLHSHGPWSMHEAAISDGASKASSIQGRLVVFFFFFFFFGWVGWIFILMYPIGRCHNIGFVHKLLP